MSDIVDDEFEIDESEEVGESKQEGDRLCKYLKMQDFGG
jgi:hypothetical protein